jgi:hypothetical protein
MRGILVDGGKSTQFGDHVYYLIAEDGEMIASHICSSRVYAPGDLWDRRKERQEQYAHKNIEELVWLEDSDISEEELRRRNKELVSR